MKNTKKKTLKGAESLPPVIAYSTPTNTNYLNTSPSRTVHSSQLNQWSQRDINNLPTAVKQNVGFPDVSANSSNASPASSANRNLSGVMYDPFTPTKSKQRNSAIKLIGNSNGSKRIILRDKNFDESFNAQSDDFSKRQNVQYLKNSETFDKQGKNFLKTNKNNLFQSYYDYYSKSNDDYKPYVVLEDGTVHGLGGRPSNYELDKKSQRTWAIVDVNSLYGKKQKKNKKKNTNKLNYLENSVRKMF